MKAIIAILLLMWISYSEATAQDPCVVGSASVSDGLDIVIYGDYAYVADNWYGLRVVNISDPTNPTNVNYYDTSGNASGADVSGNYAYVADRQNGVQILNVYNPENLVHSGHTNGWANDVCVSGDYAYVAAGSYGVEIFNVATPWSSFLVGAIETDGYAAEISVLGVHAFVADGPGGMKIINISDPAAAFLEGSVPGVDDTSDIFVVGDYAYFIDGEGLKLVDVSVPTSPYIVGAEPEYSSGSDVFVAGGFAYISGGRDGLLKVDVSDPSHPVVVGSADTGFTNNSSVYVYGEYSFVAGDFMGLKVVENDCMPPLFSDFSADVTIGDMPLTVQFTDKSYGGIVSWLWDFGDGGTSGEQNPTHTYTSADTFSVSLTISDGIDSRAFERTRYIVTAPVSAVGDVGMACRLVGNYPNPFNPRTTIVIDAPGDEAVSLRVYDLSGRLVGVLLDHQIVPTGRKEILWSGNDRAGRRLPAGAYFYRLDAGGYSETKKMVLVK